MTSASVIPAAPVPNSGFRRIAVVNRGEAAMRLIHAVRELNEEQGRQLRTIAFHTPPERRAMFVREADEAVCIGPSAPGDHPPGRSPYLDYAELERALLESRAEAAWPGWGFVAEHPEFADLCDRLGVVFIGPPGEVMRRLGDKIGAKLLAERARVPVAPWSGGPVESLEEARKHAADIGYPLLVKAAAGGGGRGIRMVEREDELGTAFERARTEAERSFGNPTVFMERRVTGARHVEVQIIADNYGDAWAVGVRDCTIQRRNQKIIEESHSTVLSGEQEQSLRLAGVNLVRAAHYRGAGTVEFLFDPDEQRAFFLEVNTRLQVEHPVTELTTGVDLVKLQLLVAAGARLEGDPPASFGHAIEARLNAEDPQRGFAPAPGMIEFLSLPTGPGIRVDTGVAEGDVISPEYDSMIAKILAWGRDREEARGRLKRALSQTTVVVRDGTTNKAFLEGILDRPEMRSGTLDTGWLDRLITTGYDLAWRADVALVMTAVESYEQETDAERARFYGAALRGRPQTTHDMTLGVDARYAGASYRLTVVRTAPSRYRVDLDGRPVEVDVERTGRFERRLVVGAEAFRVVVVPQGPEYLIEVDGVPHRVSREGAGVVRAPAPGLIVAVKVRPGDVVDEGASLAVLESMKMETSITSAFAGRVREVFVSAGVQIGMAGPLLELEPLAGGGDGAIASSPRIDFDGLAAEGDHDGDPATRCREALSGLRWAILGYDMAAGDVHQLVERFEEARAALPSDHAEVLGDELALLRTFADLCVLSRNRRMEDEEDREEAHNPREYFHAFLRSLDAEAEGLPESFRDKLSQALGHYGVFDLERTPDLEEALYRIYLAEQRVPAHLPAVLALLGRWLRHPHPPSETIRASVRETLDRLILATQLRYPLVGDAARRVRFGWFDQPLIARARERVHEEVHDHLAHLAADPGAPDRRKRIDQLVASPQPVLGLLTRHRDDPMLEVMTRRYYKIRSLEHVRSFTHGEHRFLTAEYDHRGQRTGVVATDATGETLPSASEAVADVAREARAATAVVADLYVTWLEWQGPTDALAARIAEILGGAQPPETLRRIAVAVHTGETELVQLTFRRDGARFVEDAALRGLHPMIAERLQLWRLANFEIRRLPAAEDVYLFDCVARGVEGDERLVALAEVRDLTPVLDARGRAVALPELEYALDACLDSLRLAQAERRPSERLEWNRVLLYVWPPLAVALEDLAAVLRTLAPRTEAIGLEQITVQCRIAETAAGDTREVLVRMARPPGAGLSVEITDPPTEPLRPMDAYTRKVLQARRRGTVYPYELVPLLTRSPLAGPQDTTAGGFTEYDLDTDGRPVPVDRPFGQNTANFVLGIVRTPTERYPEGIIRVALFGDPTKSLGSIAEPESRRVLAAIDMAEELGVPIEWFAVSAGVKISMESGTENMDWASRVLRRLVDFTQAGGEVNVVVAGINVGAQPYWNAEATMLMHTRGILVMTPDSAMVLTGKHALDYSGGVSAEDNFGIGGYDRIMGPNGEAQYWAPNLAEAWKILFTHYEHAYVAPGERFPRPAPTDDPIQRDVCSYPHTMDGVDFTSVGDIFSEATNPGRKKPFDIRTVMRAVADQDHPPLERWRDLAESETVVVFDAHLGGQAVTLLGVESRPLPRRGLLPADGPEQWSAGTLFPLSSKKMARAINAASGNRPVVVLANLSGFDGSPESLRRLQLEYGAEIGRAVVNFDGPFVFCVISRYHGGAFVVFSAALNESMEVAAVEGSHASVIGGPPAAAVVFAGEVNARSEADPRVREAEARAAAAVDDAEAALLRAQAAGVRSAARTEKMAELAGEFDRVHSVERARQVGSVHHIIPAARLRPYLVEAVERGIRRTLERRG